LAKSFEGIFGGIFDQNVHLRDSRHAANAYGFNKADLSNGTPRHKFEFFLRINFNQNPDVRRFVEKFLTENDKSIVSTMVKTVTMPSMSIDTEVLNQYNKKRISQSRIDYNPVSITMHDSVEGRTLRLWEMYYEYYFKDGDAFEKLGSGGGSDTSTFLGAFFEAFAGHDAPKRNQREYENDIIKDRFNDNYGYNLKRVGNNKYLIDSIEIFQVHGGKFSRTEIIHPRVTAFTHDTLDYEATSDLVQMQFEFAYEGVVYANINERLNADELDRYRYGDFNELANLITIRTPVLGRAIQSSNKPAFPDTSCPPNVPGGFSVAGSLLNSFISSPIGSVVTGIVGQQNVQRVADGIGGVVGSIPNAIGTVAAASIFGGTVSFNPDPIQALRTTANQIGRSAVNRTRDNFAAGVSAASNTVVTGIVDSVTTPGTPDGS
jgi:hypothetical protein